MLDEDLVAEDVVMEDAQVHQLKVKQEGSVAAGPAAPDLIKDNPEHLTSLFSKSRKGLSVDQSDELAQVLTE